MPIKDEQLFGLAAYDSVTQGGDTDSEYVDLAIQQYKKHAEVGTQLEAMKACLRLAHVRTGLVKLEGKLGTITVAVPKDATLYVNDDFNVVYDTNKYSSTKLLKLVERLVARGKVSPRTLERCRSDGTAKLGLKFPTDK